MSKTNDIGYSASLNFGTVLFLIFLTLKLTGYIAWSWWWVTAPLWVPAAAIFLIIAIVAVIAGAKK